MKRFFFVLMIALFSTASFAEGLKQRLADPAITEVYQLCEQLGVEDGTTITVEQCTNPDRCIVIRVDCSLHDDEES